MKMKMILVLISTLELGGGQEHGSSSGDASETTSKSSPPSSTQSTLPCPGTEPERSTCTTPQCYSTASRLLSLMNMAADPCEDFYSYACGGVHSPTLLADDLSVDVWRRMERAVKIISEESPLTHKKYKQFYEGCVEYDSLITMDERKKQGKEMLDSIGTFQPEEDELAPGAITDLLIKLFQHGSAPLFDLHLAVDYEIPGRFQVVISPSSLLFSGSHFLSAEEKTKRCRHKAGDHTDQDANKVYKNYLDCLQNISEFMKTTEEALESFGVFENENMRKDILDSIEEVLFNVTKDLTAEEYVKATQSREVNYTPLRYLEDPVSPYYIPEVNWNTLVTSLMKVNEPEEVRVEVFSLKKMKQIFSGLEDLSRQRRMYNALLAVFAHDLYNELVTSHHSCDRERYCLQVAASLMPSVAANLYMATFPSLTLKKLRTQVLSKNIHLSHAIRNIVDERPGWMDDNTHWAVKQKINVMAFQCPENLFNDSDITERLKECLLDKKNYLEDSICLMKEFQKQLYSRFNKDPNSFDARWLHFSTPFSTEITYIYGLNSLLIPLAVIGPVYDSEMPQHIQAAKLGNLVARGYGHAFDRTGMKFSYSGKFGAMLSEESYPSFEQVVEDTRSDKNGFLFEDGHQYNYVLDPDLTLNVQLADITAANLSLRIVTENDKSLPWVPFTLNQVYFITLAQEFCSKKTLPEMIPSMFEGRLLPSHRVENIVKNSEEFAKVFRCPEGSRMNKDHNTKIKPFPSYNNLREEED